MKQKGNMGPLKDRYTVVVIGGGPGGAACAIALKKLAGELGRRIRVILYEGKIFADSTHYNQCAGVLSPPIAALLEQDLRVAFPWHLVQREIKGYVLHSASQEITLIENGEVTYALRRVNFDEYMLQQAAQSGVEVIQSRVTDIEIGASGVEVYSESSNSRADVVVGAFGLDDGTARIFERATPYRQPSFFSSIVTTIHPGESFMAGVSNYIHAFLPPIKGIEFGAITPKMNHLTVNIAGMAINSGLMDRFLDYSPVREILPPSFGHHENRPLYFKGKFPFGTGKGFYGDRYVIVGDAAGLLRPFKGKGVNTSIVTAIRAAKTIMLHGISAEAFERYYRDRCKEVIDDIPYGKILRWLAIRAANTRLLDAVIELSREDKVLRNALFHCVSAHKTFKRIFHDTWSVRLLFRVLRHLTRFYSSGMNH